MNSIKRSCALLLAIVLALGVALQPGIGGVFAENTEQTEQVTEPAAEPAEEPTTEPAAEPEVKAGTNGELPVLSFYEQLMACGSLADLDALMRAEENTAALDALTQEELKQLLERVEEIYAAIEQPTEADALLKEELLKELNEHIIVICPECAGEGGVHNEGCSALAPVCTCGGEGGAHTEECPLYVPAVTVCPECGEADGHGETCSQYAAEPVRFPWTELTDPELAAWLMDPANADTVKAILSGGGEEYDALNSRIEAILSGEDAELARQVQESLSALLGLDEPEVLAADDYIYFDLAAGDVEIGKSGYTGWVYVAGVATEVTGSHKDENKYYVYQSTDANKMETGYATKDDFTNKQNCRIPAYPRVSYNGELWTKYITNNTEVEEVSEAWETAAVASDRTALGVHAGRSDPASGNHIIFASASNYQADVTIDNIWTYYHVRGATTSYNQRREGGITAHLKGCQGVEITLRLKGDNRFGNIHYSAEQNANNKIIFINGEDEGKEPGSITVADFPNDFSRNHWCAAIGGDDDICDRSAGIVIKSGVIYAGTTPADNCTAIGGGGNGFGSVTIDGGIVTAVAATTGTAIGGGIGWSGSGGNAEVTITNGEVYAYNHGVDNSSTDKFEHYVPAVAIGGGSSQGSEGNKFTTVTIRGGKVYAQCMGGAAIGGGGSATKEGGGATIIISGGEIIAKSTTGTFKGTQDPAPVDIPAGVSIGGGTGKTGGGSVTLEISAGTLRTGSIGGGKTTGTGTLGSATVTINGGDIVGQVIMAGTGDSNKKCSFTMTDGRLHSTNLIDGNTITDIHDPQQDVPILYLEKNGGAVWMQDPHGVTNISGGTIENCTAELGGAVYMEGGTFTLSGTGVIQGNTASGTYDKETGRGGGVYVTGGNANIQDGSISGNTAHVRGGGIYVSNGNVTMSGGSVSGNHAAGNGGSYIGRGGGVYLSDGLFTMEGGKISGNSANYRGGGIFLTQSPTLIEGTISGNSATDSGGGLCINGDQLVLTSAKMQIFGNEAAKGGGVAVLNGEFILRGGAVGLNGAVGDDRNRATKGGGVYVANDANTSAGADAHASVTVYSGSIWYNYADEGGGVYLDKGEGNFTLEGKNAVVSHNEAHNGGGIYLYKDPNLNQGTIEANTATENGGGMYISDCLVTLNPTSDVIITGNHAQNGAGIYIHNSNPSDSGGSGSAGSSVDAVSSATIPANGVGLLVDSNFTGSVRFTNNEAEKSGGAVCVDVGRFYLHSDRITITGNQAENGGGVAVLNGNFTMSAGSIGEENGANHATNGGGVYVSGGEVWHKGGSVQYNTATDGGGAYVTGGRIVMMGGSLANNVAERNGGGAYAAGNFRMLGGTVGGDGGGNRAENGGGVYVNEGNVYIIYGEISHNYASQDGGGFHVSSAGSAVEVEMLSGSLSYNEAGGNGGGMAVESTNNTKITVKIGCLLNHYDPSGSGEIKLPIDYTEAYTGYAEFDGKPYRHESCPKVEHNQAGSIGGGFYMNSDASTLYFYCVEETENIAKGTGSTAGMDVVGGKVIIGDEQYHNHKHDAGQENPHVVPWGYISMDDATLVNGGQVDIYGDMTNPVFKNEVTVDIQDTANDHFIDHRLSKDSKRYKVHYFENFQDTGLYEAFQYNEGHTEITIEGALYSHPGYEILGWCTQPIRNEGEENNHYYEVGTKIDLASDPPPLGLGIHPTKCPICGDKNDETLLVLYAIWEANGYTVVFDPNVPVGDTYSGTMADQIHQYDQTQALTGNAYQYPGHFFKGWNTKADGTGTAYTDGQEVQNLTTQNGGKVVLYAQWEPCDHKDHHRWSYEVSEDGKTLLRICSCGGQTLTATLYAEDTVYDGHSHPASLTLDDQEAWGEDAPIVTYKGERLNAEDEKYGTLQFDQDGLPYHAGAYTASITKPDGNAAGAVTASVKYIIAKADQEAPGKPTYTVTGNQLTINKVTDDPHIFQDGANHAHTANAQYHLSYYRDNSLESTQWQTMNGSDTLSITMTDAWTSYYVEVRYEELEDYNASDITRADAEYHYAGDVTVKIICDEGISYRFIAALTDEQKFDGAKLILTPKTGYYIVSGKYSVQKQLNDEPAEKVEPGPDGVYSFTGIPDSSTLTITIGTARKEPQVKAQVAPRQIFHAITGDSATISRDSAFTAAFQIGNFDPCYTLDGNSYGAYTGLKLTFDQKIPKDTTIILLDRGDGTYWYYRAGTEVSSVPLTAFKKMGGNGSESYSIPLPAKANGYIDLSYQFIVDFSQSASGYSEDSLTMTLEAEKNDAAVPEVKPAVTVTMKDPSFKFDLLPANGLTNSFTCSFSTEGAASKWENRASALVLTPNTDLPPDACIKAEVNGGTTYLYKSGNSFIVPLSLLKTEEKTVTLTLRSALFPPEEASYSFTAKWLISPSTAGKAPMAGDQKGEQTVTFTSAKKVVPSLKMESSSRILTSQDTLELEVTKKNLDGYTISAALLRKSDDGTYLGTGWNQTVAAGQQKLSVSLGGQNPGSFCLMLTVKQENSITIVMEVPYYFVIKAEQ